MSTLTAALMNTIALAGALDPIRVFIRRFVVLSHDQATTVALWIAHTHAIDAGCHVLEGIDAEVIRKTGNTLLKHTRPHIGPTQALIGNPIDAAISPRPPARIHVSTFFA